MSNEHLLRMLNLVGPWVLEARVRRYRAGASTPVLISFAAGCEARSSAFLIAITSKISISRLKYNL